jgi:antitoxin PrlF
MRPWGLHVPARIGNIPTAFYFEESGMSSGTVSSKGQVVIPQKLRKALGIRTGSRVQMTQDGNAIRLTPLPGPALRTAAAGYGLIRYRGPRVRIEDMDPTAALGRLRK